MAVFSTSLPQFIKDKLQHTKISAECRAKKWIQGPPLPHFQSTSFFDNYGRLGWVYQRTLAEDALTNSSLVFLGLPQSDCIHQAVQKKSRTQFFNDQLRPFALWLCPRTGFGIQHTTESHPNRTTNC